MRFKLLSLLLLCTPVLAEDWYRQDYKKTYFDIQVNLEGIELTKLRNDQYLVKPWLENGVGASKLRLSFAELFDKLVPFEFNPSKAHVIYTFKVSGKLKETKYGLKVSGLQVDLDVLQTRGATLVRPNELRAQVAAIKSRTKRFKIEGPLEDIELLISGQARSYMESLNHREMLHPRVGIYVFGSAFSGGFSPGSLGSSRLMINDGLVQFQVNGRDRMVAKVGGITLTAVEAPIFWPTPIVKLENSEGEVWYFRFVDRANHETVRKRVRLVNKFITSIGG